MRVLVLASNLSALSARHNRTVHIRPFSHVSTERDVVSAEFEIQIMSDVVCTSENPPRDDRRIDVSQCRLLGRRVLLENS